MASTVTNTGSRARTGGRALALLVVIGALVAAACGAEPEPETQAGIARSEGVDNADGSTTDDDGARTPPPTVADDTTTAPPTSPTTAAPTTAATPPPITDTGVAFASAIAADGRALDPATEFPASINRLYAVFLADGLPSGLELSVDDPEPGVYYAYLRTAGGSNLSTFGWRWINRGDVVVEYEAEAAASEFFWLERFDRSEYGIFGGNVAATGLGPGRYTVEFTVSGNALFAESFTITE